MESNRYYTDSTLSPQQILWKSLLPVALSTKVLETASLIGFPLERKEYQNTCSEMCFNLDMDKQ